MPIPYRASIGDILLCEFGPDPEDAATFPIQAPAPPPIPPNLPEPVKCLSVKPEMYKLRPVVVLSTNAPNSLVMIAPFSTQPPVPVKAYHHFIPAGSYAFLNQDTWLKADMMMAVSKERLERLTVGGLKRPTPLRPDDRAACQKAALNALGLGRLVPHF